MSGIQTWLMTSASFLLTWQWLPLLVGAAVVLCAAPALALSVRRRKSRASAAVSSRDETAYGQAPASAPTDPAPAMRVASSTAVPSLSSTLHRRASGPLHGAAEWRVLAEPVDPAPIRQTATTVLAPPVVVPAHTFPVAGAAVDSEHLTAESAPVATDVAQDTPSADALAEQEYRHGLRLVVRQSPDREEPLRAALACFRRAQEHWTRERAPERWAAIQNDIGRIYQELPSGDRAQHLRTAIMYHQSALEVFDPATHPTNWAWTQAALGAAYLNTPSGSPIVNARAAVAYYQRALDIFSVKDSPLAWAWTQNNLGAAFETMRGGAEGERVAHLRDAAECYRAALLVFTREAYPAQHQLVTHNLERIQADLRAVE